MAKLWQKDSSLNKLVEKFTVGEDYLLDRRLINSDCVASIAHAAMLNSIGILKNEEFQGLRRELRHIIELNKEGDFTIEPAEEDCHTAIENHLTAVLGEAGKKIHTGRSRNDQIIAAIRLYSRSFLLDFQRDCLNLVRVLLDFAGKNSSVPMPGRTHMQLAMPSSVGLWAGAFAEEILDDLSLIAAAYKLNNMSPLGSAASYGVPLPIDREQVAAALGFKKVQNNVLYVNNSRGKIEAVILDAVEKVMLTLSKIAQDIILFSMPEFGYFTLPDNICRGSSIMPQKKNPDILELIRAKAASVSLQSLQIKSIIRALPSGYNADFQETKPPFIRGADSALSCVRIMALTMSKLQVNEEKLAAGFLPEIYAADRAVELVGKGMPFREAYRQVAAELDKLENKDPYEAIRQKTHSGATGNLGLEMSAGRVRELGTRFQEESKRVEHKVALLAGAGVKLFNLK